jgi:hypothetical protein
MNALPTGVTAPSLFVRMITGSGPPASLIPFGAITATAQHNGAAVTDHIGYYFRIETPLPIQNYATSQGCISRWFALRPAEPNAADIKLIRERLLQRWHTGIYKFFDGFIRGAEERQLKKWARVQRDDDSLQPGVLYITSHHGDSTAGIGTLVLDDGDEMSSIDVKRQFATPTLVVLNACGTVRPGGDSFLKAFSYGNAATIIGTKYSVPVDMALDFTDILDDKMRKAPPGTTIGTIFFDTILALRNKKGEEAGDEVWGGHALAYTLAGNSGVVICAPTGAQQ